MSRSHLFLSGPLAVTSARLHQEDEGTKGSSGQPYAIYSAVTAGGNGNVNGNNPLVGGDFVVEDSLLNSSHEDDLDQDLEDPVPGSKVHFYAGADRFEFPAIN